ncbi:MAG: S41 family peptidase [Clostridiales bacterium]|jgi:carboxyl-terminal processing protease|nr:S41 family peptidase [Clostridiales bacterium]
MNKNDKTVRIVAVTILLTAAMTFMAASAFYAFVLKARSTAAFPGSQKIYEVLTLLDREYYYGVDKEQLIDTALDTMISSLGDPYSVYMDPEEYRAFYGYLSGTYAGVGAVVSWDWEENAVVIVKPFDGSPAQKAGLVKGDKVVKIDGLSLEGTDLDGAVAKMKGEAGTSVTLTVLKADGGEPAEVPVIREEVHIPTVESELRGDIGYIAISMFDPATGDDFGEHLQAMTDGGAKGILLDLRDNGGGLVPSVTAVADYLLDAGEVIFYTQDKDGKRADYTADGGGIDLPLAVLVNENTASAAELLAGTLRDNKNAPLVGKTTFGKGVVQSTYPLSDGSVVKLTIEKYFTPNGNDINTVGLKPDYEVEPQPEADEQYQRAAALLEEQLR